MASSRAFRAARSSFVLSEDIGWFLLRSSDDLPRSSDLLAGRAHAGDLLAQHGGARLRRVTGEIVVLGVLARHPGQHLLGESGALLQLLLALVRRVRVDPRAEAAEAPIEGAERLERRRGAEEQLLLPHAV